MELGIKSREISDNTWILSLKGSVDSFTCEELEKQTQEILDQTTAHILIDLAKVQYISSMGIGTLLSLFKEAKESGGSFLVYDARFSVKRVFEISKLDFLEIHPEKTDSQNPFHDYLQTEEPERKNQRQVEVEKRMKEAKKRAQQKNRV